MFIGFVAEMLDGRNEGSKKGDDASEDIICLIYVALFASLAAADAFDLSGTFFERH